MTDETGPRRRSIFTGVAAAGFALAGTRAAATTAPKTTTGPIIINALGGIENPNIEAPRQTAALADTTLPMVDDRAVRDALASGVTAVHNPGLCGRADGAVRIHRQIHRRLGPFAA